MKIQIFNGTERQIFIDTKGKNNPDDIKLIGIKETVILDIDEKVLKKLKATLPHNVIINIK